METKSKANLRINASTKLNHIFSSEQGSLLIAFGTHSASEYVLLYQSILWADADEAFALLKEAETVGSTSLQGLECSLKIDENQLTI